MSMTSCLQGCAMYIHCARYETYSTETKYKNKYYFMKQIIYNYYNYQHFFSNEIDHNSEN